MILWILIAKLMKILCLLFLYWEKQLIIIFYGANFEVGILFLLCTVLVFST